MNLSLGSPPRVTRGFAHYARLFRTVRHLRCSQLSARAWRAAQRSLPRRRISTVQAAEPGQLRHDFPEVPTGHHSVSVGEKLVRELERGEFQILNQLIDLGRGNTDWRLGPRTSGRLWTVTLHYHQWLYELAVNVVNSRDNATAARSDKLLTDLLTDWLDRCSLAADGAPALAWNPYAVATRLTWWIQAYHRLGPRFTETHSALASRWRQSIWDHAVFLHGSLEWDLRANHLLRDLVGLAYAGRFFSGREPDRWLSRAAKLALPQIEEQILTDGAHFERSPMYHLEVMGDVLSLSQLIEETETQRRLTETWVRMAEFSRWIQHTDGTAVQFNDGAGWDVQPLLEHGRRLVPDFDVEPPRGGHHFKGAGIVAWRGGSWNLFFDVGEVGPDFQPGHAHADTLTVDCSLGGRRLFVDPGCYHYDNDAIRQYDRATSSHNTVCIDDQDSSEVWHIFRVGRRARVVGVETDIDTLSMAASATHTGYDHLPGKPRHSRSIRVTDPGPLVIRDRVTGARDHSVTGGFLLAPGWKASSASDGWMLTTDSESVRVQISSKATLELSTEPADFHPDYGVRTATQRLRWSYRGNLPLEVETRVERVSS